MNDSLYIAATGMQSQQTNLDTIANNLANMSTSGFKTGRVNFQDMVYRLGQFAGAEGSVRGGPAHGTGVSVLSSSMLFTTGALQQTSNPMDLAIQGAGLFEVSLPDGSHAYSRGGALQVNADGFLATADGNALKPTIHIGTGVKNITIASDGRVLISTGEQSTPSEVGTIEMSNFSDPSSLVSLGRNLYKPSVKSGDPIYSKPGTNGAGTLAQGFSEGSNVNIVTEMVNLMSAQRAYEMSVKVIQASDEMLGMSNNLRR